MITAWFFCYQFTCSKFSFTTFKLLHSCCRYFETLQKELALYDCILYEMVASRESLENKRTTDATKRLKGSRSRGFNIIGCIQRQMARILTLDFQLDCLDYQAENWYHADLDYETFKLLQVRLAIKAFKFLNIRVLTLSEVIHSGRVILLSQRAAPASLLLYYSKSVTKI